MKREIGAALLALLTAGALLWAPETRRTGGDSGSSGGTERGAKSAKRSLPTDGLLPV